jgi:hypothetical protein
MSPEETNGMEKVEIIKQVRMTTDEAVLYLSSQKGIAPHQRSLSIRPSEFHPSLGHDISSLLRQNVQLASRGQALVEICNDILSKEPSTKILVVTDGRIGGGIAARRYLCETVGPGCTWLDPGDSPQRKMEKIGWYQCGDATADDKARPRVLVLHYEHAAGLNLQHECHHLILLAPLYIGEGGGGGPSGDDPVSDASMELQAIGRVFRPGQPHPKVYIYRIEVLGPNGEECLDGQLIRRNMDPKTLQEATSNEDADGGDIYE